MKNKFILLVEDDEGERDSIIRDFEESIPDEKIGEFKCEIHSSDSESEALKLYEEHYYDLIILDLRLAEGDGRSLLEKIRKNDKTTPILVLSGEAIDRDFREIGKHFNTYFFEKGSTEEGKENLRRAQCIKCLQEGEENFEKTHGDFYLPPVLTSFLFGSTGLYGETFSLGNKIELLRYFRNPHKGFEGKGVFGLFDQVGAVVSMDIEDITSKFLKRSSEVDFAKITEQRIRGDYSLKNMEKFLTMERGYREHFVHQFQNFLVGCIIYSQFKSQIDPQIKRTFKKYSRKPITNTILRKLFNIGWYLTSLFHDCAYPIEYYDKLYIKYFKENFRYRFVPRLMSMEDLILPEGLHHHFDSLADDFWGKNNRKEEYKMLLTHKFKEKNHAIHSSIALRKLIRYHERGEEFSGLFSPVYSAIAMHDWDVWANAKEIVNFLERNQDNFDHKIDFHYNLNFLAELKKNPFLHILIIVDTLQGWGRSIEGKYFYSTYHLELVDISNNVDEGFLTFELNVREGAEPETDPEIFCKFCQTFKTLSVILGENGLPIKVILNRGLNADSTVTFRLGIGEQIDCENTDTCPKKE